MGLWLLSLGFSFQEGYKFQDFLVLEQQSLRHNDCNNKKTLSFSWFHFLLMSLLKHCSLECDSIRCSIYLIDFGAWLLFKAFAAAKLVSLNWFGTLLLEHTPINFPFPFWHGLKNINSLSNWNIVVLYLLCCKFCHYDMSTGGRKFLYVLSWIVCFGIIFLFFPSVFRYSLLQS